LNDNDLNECAHGKSNLKKAFSVLHDIIYLFQGEPTQLMQMHDSDLKSYPQYREFLDDSINEYFENAKKAQ
jgi:hypothetical protein